MAADDPELATALKVAKGKQMYFAFIPKGPSDGKLIIKKAKIPAKEIAAARKELGGGMPVTGRCMGTISDMVFTTVKPAPGTLAKALKLVTKRDAGMPVVATFQLASDADADEEDAGADSTAAAPAAPSASSAAAPAAQAGGADVDDDEDDEDDEDEDEDEAGPADLSKWKTAVQQATNDLKELAKKVAGTRHESAKGVLGEINGIIKDIGKLPDNPTNEQIERHQAFLSQHDGLAAAEETPEEFHALNIRSKLLDALDAAKQSVANA